MASDGSSTTVSSEAWPAIGAEERAWVARMPAELVSAAVRSRHTGSYSAALVPLIEQRTPQLPAAVLALSEEASSEIARFDAELGHEVAPFASVLLRSESASSSMIENLSSGSKAIVLAEMGSTQKRNALEIVGNVAAMRAALALADKLDESAVLTMHAALMEAHDLHIAGRWREEQVWIGGDSFGPHGAGFVPPHQEHVPTLMRDLVSFARRSDLPLLAQTAIAHAQFETIHPFPDGNGRTGRALVHAMLRGHGLTRNVTVPVSAGLLTDTGRYFDALTSYRRGDPSAIVETMAEATFAATTNGRQLVGELRALRAEWAAKIKARSGSTALRLADVLIRQPIVDAATVSAELGVTVQNAQRAIAPLVDAEVLVEFTGFERNRMWQSGEVLSALDEFAARAGRRNRG